MQIIVHDYSGHPGQVQLCRALAARDHRVVHQHCPSYVTGKGAVARSAADPDNLTFEQCPMRTNFNRYSVVHRVVQEVQYGIKVGRLIVANPPDVAIISNVPLLAHALLSVRLRRRRIPMVFWQQDIYSSAIGAAAKRKLPRAGRPIAWIAEWMERSIARSSAAIVAISPTFMERLRVWGVADKTTVIPNWAPIDEIPVHEKLNAWSDRMGLTGVPVVMYSGTLGLKHDPSLLALISTHLKEANPDARMVVVSEGLGRLWLQKWKHENDAENLDLLDFQPYEDLPDMLAAADVLVAILEPDASKYSVPSKALTYLCSERAILGVLPRDNSVAEILLTQHAGLVAEPSERAKVTAAVAELLNDDVLRRELGKAGRQYAEREFSPEHAADQFELILRTVTPRHGSNIGLI
jgi:colanic acid biosynthesis glycosyl transferase WcaI